MTDAFYAMLCVVILAVFLVNCTGPGTPLDSTDNRDTGVRSDMTVLTDHGTGCQYLTTGRGGLTPRLDSDGKPMCSK